MAKLQEVKEQRMELGTIVATAGVLRFMGGQTAFPPSMPCPLAHLAELHSSGVHGEVPEGADKGGRICSLYGFRPTREATAVLNNLDGSPSPEAISDATSMRFYFATAADHSKTEIAYYDEHPALRGSGFNLSFKDYDHVFEVDRVENIPGLFAQLVKAQEEAVASILFPLGDVLVTAGAMAKMEEIGDHPDLYIDRHCHGDFGDLDKEDTQANLVAIGAGGRILSCYTVAEEKFYVITEANRSTTTLMLASEY